MAEEFQGGGVCGTTAWWNPSTSSLFSGGLSSPCSVAQLGGSFDMPTFGWPNEVLIKGNNDNNRVVNIHNSFDNSTLDILGFGLSPTSSIITDWSHPNSIINNGDNDLNYDSIFMEDRNFKMNSSNITNSTNISYHHNFTNNYNYNNNSPPQATSGDSTSNTSESGLIPNSAFQMSSTASYLIQTLFEDIDDPQVLEPQLPISQPINNSNYGYGVMDSSHELMTSSPNIAPIQNSMQLGQNNECHGGMNGQYSTATSLRSNIHASLLNSQKSRSRAPTQSCAYIATNKANMEDVHDSKGNTNNQPPAKRPRIETPSSLPSFKVRKEKLGDRITALQQLVSPFGKTDTASVLHEAIEYIKFLHDQVNASISPYLENGVPMQHHQEYKEGKEDLRSRGLCLVPISSTYPIVQETSVDFWTPTFGGQEFT